MLRRMDLATLAVPHTLTYLRSLLPEPPATILEAGCGQGALAAAMASLGYDVTGVDRDADAVAAARERGVPVIHADVRDVSGKYDVVLFTRSLHHADDLDGILAHAATLLTPGGQIIIEEFAWERVDHAAADFLYDTRALLVAADVLDAELPSGGLLEAWVAGHDFLHRGAAMLDALDRAGGAMSTVDTPMLWRLINGRGGSWAEPATRVLDVVRQAEQRRIAAGTLPSVGVLASIHR
jgi:SAM-dependent methyltransferase